jgi:hypothetical protein
VLLICAEGEDHRLHHGGGLSEIFQLQRNIVDQHKQIVARAKLGFLGAPTPILKPSSCERACHSNDRGPIHRVLDDYVDHGEKARKVVRAAVAIFRPSAIHDLVLIDDAAQRKCSG